MTSPRKAVLFVRVSSKEQQDGYSLEAQEQAGDEWAARHDLEIVKRWVVAETARTDELRKSFKDLIAFVRSNPTIPVLLFEKPDRMTRNFKDLVTIYELIERHDKEVHFFRTGLRLNKDSKSSDQIQLDIQVVLARNFITNLREEVKKGMRMKVQSGSFPAVAPVGYRNNTATSEIEPDPAQAPLVKKIFELYSTGHYAIRDLDEIVADLGLRFRNNPKPLSRGSIHSMLHNPIYYGLVRWGGDEAMGKHEPLITKDLYDRVQEVLGGEARPQQKHEFAFRGLAYCGKCGSYVTAERHKKQQKNGVKREYVYYHCTGWKNSGVICKGSYLREEELIAQLAEPLKQFRIDKRVLAEIKLALKESFAGEKEYTKARVTTLQAEESRVKNRLDQAYLDKLDGTLTPEEYREKSSAWRSRLFRLREEIRGTDGAHDLYLEEGYRILDLAQRAHAIFTESKDAASRRKLIELIVSKVVISGKKAVSNLREPFAALSKLAVAANSGKGRQEWYPGPDLNRRPAV